MSARGWAELESGSGQHTLCPVPEGTTTNVPSRPLVGRIALAESHRFNARACTDRAGCVRAAGSLSSVTWIR